MANSLPFNSIEHDRVYKAEDWAWYFSTFIANGIFPKPSDGMQVIAYSGLEIKVNMGYAFINGYAFRNPAAKSITLAVGDGAQPRIDRIVVRWDLPQRDVYIDVLKGQPSARPQAPALTRTMEIWELAIADVYISKGTTKIQQKDITDQRFNSALCGIVTGTVEEIDASTLTIQFNDFFNTYSEAVLDEFSVYRQNMEKYIADIAGIYSNYVSQTENLFAQYEQQFTERYSSFENTLNKWDEDLLSAYTDYMARMQLFLQTAENDFNTWFETVKGRLGEDIAGALELEIEALTAKIEDVKQQEAEAAEKTAEALQDLDKRVTLIENGWNINYKHDAVLGLCYMAGAYLSQHYERTVEAAILGVAYIGNAYLADTF